MVVDGVLTISGTEYDEKIYLTEANFQITVFYTYDLNGETFNNHFWD